MENTNEDLVFIGARQLSANEAVRLLPNFDNVSVKIEEFRKIAMGNENGKSIQKKEYTNTISILGARGTGKTSIMYTINSQLKNDIVLDMIRPDYITSSGTITANILGLLKNEMLKLLKEVKKSKNDYKKFPELFKNCIYKEINEYTEKFDKMYEFYCYCEDEYKNVLVSQYTNFDSYAKKSSLILNADSNFQAHLCEFVEMLLKLKKKLNGNKEQPLLIIFIDDIDLRTSKVEEVINALQSYSSCNKVVTIISADYSTFLDSLHISLINKDNLPNGFDMYSDDSNTKNGNNYFVKKKTLTREFIKKFLPSALRFEINKWDLYGRANYSFTVKNNEDKEVNLILMEKLLELIQKCGSSESFFYYVDEDGKKVPLLSFFNIFDNTARGLVNVFHSLYYAINMDLSDNSKKFIAIKSLVDTIINSNVNLLNKKETIYSDYILWGNSEESSELKYENLKSFEKDIYAFNFNGLDYQELELQFCIFNLMFLTNICLDNIRVNAVAKKEINGNMFELITKYPSLNDGKTKETDFKPYYSFYVGKYLTLNFGETKETNFTPYHSFYLDHYDVLFSYKFTFGTYLYNAYINYGEKENYYENRLYSINDENLYFYGFYKAVKNYCSVNDKIKEQDFIEQLYNDANGLLLVTLNRIYDITAVDDILAIGDAWLRPIFVETISKKVDDSEFPFDNKRFFEMFLIKMLHSLDFAEVVREINSKKDSYINEGKESLKSKESSGNEIEKLMYSNIGNIIKLIQLDSKKENSPKLAVLLKQKIDSDVKKIGEIILENLFEMKADFKVILKPNVSSVLREFRNGSDGVSYTKYSEAKSSVEANLKAEDSRVIYKNYAQALIELSDLRSNSKVWYGRREAFKAYEELMKFENVELDFATNDTINYLISNPHFKVFIQLYVLYRKDNNENLDFSSKIYDAKKEFSPIMKKAFSNSVSALQDLAESNEIFDDLDI